MIIYIIYNGLIKLCSINVQHGDRDMSYQHRHNTNILYYVYGYQLCITMMSNVDYVIYIFLYGNIYEFAQLHVIVSDYGYRLCYRIVSTGYSGVHNKAYGLGRFATFLKVVFESDSYNISKPPEVRKTHMAQFYRVCLGLCAGSTGAESTVLIYL